MEGSLDPAPREPAQARPGPFVSDGGEIHLSAPGQLDLLRAVVARGASLRTTVRGGSMTPFVRDLDVVTIAPMGDAPPRVGEVVAFEHPAGARLVIHRVVAREGAGWLVRGDACPSPDGVVDATRLVGRVVTVERRGRRVTVGMGRTGAAVALLSRSGSLGPLLRVLLLPRRAARFAMRGFRRG